MSGFLENLVRRALAPAPAATADDETAVLRPMSISRFAVEGEVASVPTAETFLEDEFGHVDVAVGVSAEPRIQRREALVGAEPPVRRREAPAAASGPVDALGAGTVAAEPAPATSSNTIAAPATVIKSPIPTTGATREAALSAGVAASPAVEPASETRVSMQNDQGAAVETPLRESLSVAEPSRILLHEVTAGGITHGDGIVVRDKGVAVPSSVVPARETDATALRGGSSRMSVRSEDGAIGGAEKRTIAAPFTRRETDSRLPETEVHARGIDNTDTRDGGRVPSGSQRRESPPAELPAAKLRPASVGGPSRLSAAEAAGGQSRPVQIRVGTIEVKVTAPPPEAPPAVPTVAGFEEYEAVRRYQYWEAGL